MLWILICSAILSMCFAGRVLKMIFQDTRMHFIHCIHAYQCFFFFDNRPFLTFLFLVGTHPGLSSPQHPPTWFLLSERESRGKNQRRSTYGMDICFNSCISSSVTQSNKETLQNGWRHIQSNIIVQISKKMRQTCIISISKVVSNGSIMLHTRLIMALSTRQQGIVGWNNGLTVIMTLYLIWEGIDLHTQVYMETVVFHRLGCHLILC